jgi:hypothetical protein
MKNLIIILACGLLFTNCKRNHYYCVCNYGNGTGYDKDYGTQFTTKESTLKKDCDSHFIGGPGARCTLVAE